MYVSIVGIFLVKRVVIGGHRRYVELMHQLAEKGHKIDIISQFGFPAHRNIDNHTIGVKDKFFFLPFSIKLLLSMIRNSKRVRVACHKSDLILIFSISTLFAALYLKRRFGLPIVFGLRQDILRSREILIQSNGTRFGFITLRNKWMLKIYYWLFVKILRPLLIRVDKIIVLNQADKEQIQQLVGPSKKIDVIPNNINTSWIKREYENRNRSTQLRNMVFIGSLIERKGVMYLLKAFEQLIKDGYNFSLSILGDGRQRDEVERFIMKNNLRGSVQLYGYVENPLDFLYRSNLLVVPSLQDSFPNVIIESFYVGTPVIGSRISGIKSILNDDRLLLDPGCERSLYKKLVELLDTNYYNSCRETCNSRKKDFYFDWAEEFLVCSLY